jgi:hypothetical protein
MVGRGLLKYCATLLVLAKSEWIMIHEQGKSRVMRVVNIFM